MKIEAYAKINLTLEVFAKRLDGYHALRSVVARVGLCDILDIRATSDGEISSDSPYPDDLCLKAARILQEATHERQGATISIEKHIPAGGGLGGGSADAAATLLALNSLWATKLTRDELVRLAAKVGSDVPSLVMGGSVVMEGRGEKVAPLAPFAPFWLVLAFPGVFSSTKEVYENCISRVTDDPKILYNMRKCLAEGDIEAISHACMNDLTASAASLHREIASALVALKEAGAIDAHMSGSGSTVFGIVRDETQGRDVCAQMKKKGYEARLVKTLSGDVMAA